MTQSRFLHFRHLAPSSSSTSSILSRTRLSIPSPFPFQSQITNSFWQWGKRLFVSKDAKLPVLETRFNQLQQNPDYVQKRLCFNNKFLICGQHSLNTTPVFLNSLIQLGFDPKKIFYVGKSYSDNAESIDAIKKLNIHYQPTSKRHKLGNFVSSYNKDISRLLTLSFNQMEKMQESNPNSEGIILDDGGHLLSQMSPEHLELFKYIVGIEQTSSGVQSAKETSHPTIELASSAVKKIESHMVAIVSASKIVNKLKEIREKRPSFLLMPDNEIVIGIIGCAGTIGRAVLTQLTKSGFKKFILCDKRHLPEIGKEDPELDKLLKDLTAQDPALQFVCVDAAHGVAQANVVIGTTGTDISSGILNTFKGKLSPTILFSTSSKDTEFNSLLRLIQAHDRTKEFDPLADIEFKNGFNQPLLVVRGGTPLNFDNSPESVPAEWIQLVRALKFEAVCQASEMIDDMKRGATVPVANYRLDPKRQLAVLNNVSQTLFSTKNAARLKHRYGLYNVGETLQILQAETEFLKKNPDEIAARSGGVPYTPSSSSSASSSPKPK